MAEPKGHIFEKKKNKKKPCCSVRREEGAEGCWGLSHIGLCSVEATSQQQCGTILGEGLTFCHLASMYSILCSRAVNVSFSVASLERQDISNKLRKSVIVMMLLVMTSLYSRFAQSWWISRCTGSSCPTMAAA
ncbi:hypothetical protein Cadr_000014814 [Camelus dromedarius]|uniref:Uncharacterized protein n=1 Tax=Camelus dromedarius TaxID=9838 RepID=A0A5N4DPE0_CAMDR|nr:hypothetical protein Cadr_000014814 [Camelus dromedarius]